MLNWLKKQWADVRGNAKWDVFKYAAFAFFALLTGLVVWFRSWYLGLSVAVQVLSILLTLSILLNLALALLLVLERRHPTIKFPEQPPDFLLPRPTQVVSGKGDAKAILTVGTLSPKTLSLNYRVDSTGMRGISIWLENNGVEPIPDCQLVLISLSTWHAAQMQFRRPTFDPVALFRNLVTLQPEGKNRCSDAIWLARVSQSDAKEIEVPAKANTRLTSGGVYRAIFQVKAGDSSYQDEIHFRWNPGNTPEVIPPFYPPSP